MIVIPDADQPQPATAAGDAETQMARSYMTRVGLCYESFYDSGESTDSAHVLSPCISFSVYRHVVDLARRQSSAILPHLFHRSLPACWFSRWKAQPVSSLNFHLQ